MSRRRTPAIVVLLLFAVPLWSQNAPPVFVLPAGNSIAIILGDTERSVNGFMVYRRDSDETEFLLITHNPVVPVSDPYRAYELIGSDYRWLAGKIGSADPATVWRRLSMDRNRAAAYSLVSHGLRMAMGRTVVDMSVISGGTYTYRIVFLDAGMREISSVQRRVTAGAAFMPSRPKTVQAEPSDGEVIVTWEYPEYRGGDDTVVGFQVYRSAGAEKPVRLTPAPVLRADGYLEYFDESVENGITYRYTVTAVDLIGTESEGSTSKPVVPMDDQPPLVPTGITAVDDGEDVLVLWNISPDLDVEYYDVFRSTRSNEGFEKINNMHVPFDNPRYADSTIVRGVTHYYKIVAVDNSGNESPPGGPTHVSPRDSEPPGPVTVLAAAVDDKERTVSLTWTPPTDLDMRGYYLYRGATEDTIIRITQKPLEFEGLPKFTDTGYQNQGLRPGSSLVYAVSAVDMSYNESSLTYIAAEMPDTVPPKPPFSLSARCSPEGNVLVSWMMRTEEEIIGFKLIRIIDGELPMQIDISGFTTRYEDTHAIKGKRNTYQVHAFDSSGNESVPSKAVEIVPTDLSPPEPPREVAVTSTDSGIEINWQPSAEQDVVAYLVYAARYRGAGFRTIMENSISDTTFMHPEGKKGHLYAVSAVDSSGNEGPRSEGVSAEEGQ